jgi:hypothetical protein
MSFEHDQHIPIDDLSAYADGEVLSDDERTRIEAHLRTCEMCRSELESIRQVSSLLADLPEPVLPRSFRLSAADIEGVSAESESAEPVPIEPWLVRNQWYFRYAGLAAALLLVVVVTVDLLPTSDESADELFTTSQDVSEDEGTDADSPEDAPLIMEADDATEEADEPAMEPPQDQDRDEAAPESAPESIEDFAVDESEEDAAVEDRDTAEDAATSFEDEREQVADSDAPDTDHPQAEADPEDGEHPVSGESVPDEVDDDSSVLQTLGEDDDGLSTLQLIAIGLGAVAVVLLLVGFVLPRWWSTSAR